MRRLMVVLLVATALLDAVPTAPSSSPIRFADQIRRWLCTGRSRPIFPRTDPRASIGRSEAMLRPHVERGSNLVVTGWSER